MASEYTPNYNLDKYVGTDKPNLRDQYNSAMDKIDAQFVVIENDHTETGNQIAAINTNMTQLGERVTTAEGKVTAVEGQIGQTNTELAEVKTTADNAMSLASTNESDIATLDSEMVQVQQGVTNLQAATRTQTIYQAQQWDFEAHGLMTIHGMPQSWGSEGETFTLDAAIPSWANWIDVYLIANNSTFYNEGASSTSDTTSFASPLLVQTFPTKVATKAASSSAIEIQTITDFCFTMPPMMGTNYQGAQTVSFGAIPFRITGNQLTQNMGLAASSGGYEQWKNAFSGVGYTYTSSNPTITNSQQTASIYKIVARA